MLSNRLRFIASFVDINSSLADIGSDHGLLPLFLFEKKIITKGYASDNKLGPYQNLKKTLLNTPIEIALNDGLNNLPNYIDTVLIAGMGGLLINKILHQGKKYFSQVKTFILSPHSDIYKVRCFMEENGFKLIDEGLIYDDKYYHVLKYQAGQQSLSLKEKLFGPILLEKREEVFIDYLKKEKEEMRLLLLKPLSVNRRQEINEYLSLIEDVL